MVNAGFLPAKIKIVETVPEITRRIRGGLLELFRGGILEIRYGVVTNIKRVLRQALMEQPEYKSLVDELGEPRGTSLYTLFGILNAKEAVTKIIDTWIANIKVDSEFISGNVSAHKKYWGRVTITAIDADFRDVLDLGENISWFMSDGKHADEVRWLEWLLLRGSEVVVSDFRAIYIDGITPRWSRTNQAVMMKNGVFQVPSQYAGTIQDNWPIRAVKSAMQGGLDSLIGKALIDGAKGLLA